MKKRNVPKSLQIEKNHFPTVVIEQLTPTAPEGNFPLKRLLDEPLTIRATIYKEGHGCLRALLRWRQAGQTKWQEKEMLSLPNYRWEATLLPEKIGMIEYTIEAWEDAWLTWKNNTHKKIETPSPENSEYSLLIQEVFLLLEKALQQSPPLQQQLWKERLQEYRTTALNREQEESPELSQKLHQLLQQLLNDQELDQFLCRHADRTWATYYQPLQHLRVERQRAGIGAWYEFFPRSAEGKATSGSTFRDCLGRIQEAHAMGFDVIYFPPIHPIGLTKRKGPNNSLNGTPQDPGVPYAIGSEAGGHDALDPNLGNWNDFKWLLGEIQSRGMEVALDLALHCSPDHPYLKEHPEWFYHRPDGSIQFAENPPKKYEDIYPFNFYSSDWEALWEEILRILLFWANHGVRIFRVDNPHTKPLTFWRWLLAKVQQRYPDIIFLSEAFTHPAMMYRLAQIGFSQSYSYFTWRNSRKELEEYFQELTSSPLCDYFRPNLFTNTPDILPFYLQEGGRPAFLIRAILAATLSPLYGIYSGFELCENEAIPEKEEYLHSEKYQYKERDWNAPGNIKAWITQLNQIRRQHPALRQFCNLHFVTSENNSLIAYHKTSSDQQDQLLIVVNLNPHQEEAGRIAIPPQMIEAAGYHHDENYPITDLLNGADYQWQGTWNYVSLNPNEHPAHLFYIPCKNSSREG